MCVISKYGHDAQSTSAHLPTDVLIQNAFEFVAFCAVTSYDHVGRY
jgi:hypothetical protein